MTELFIENNQNILDITEQTEELVKTVCEKALTSEGWTLMHRLVLPLQITKISE